CGFSKAPQRHCGGGLIGPCQPLYGGGHGLVFLPDRGCARPPLHEPLMDQSVSVAHLKKALRRSARSLILALGPQERAAQETALIRLFDKLPGYAEAGTVLLYAKAFAEELETRPFLIHALEAGKRV